MIGRWLAAGPGILLLDDPTKGIDVETKHDLYRIMADLCAEGVGIILYSSEDEELLGNADRVLVFNGGRIVTELAGDRLTEFELYRAAYRAEGGVSAVASSLAEVPSGCCGDWRWILSLVVLAVLSALNAWLQPTFLTGPVIASNLTSFLPLVLVAVGQTWVVLAGDIDLSVGPIIALVNVAW